NGDVTGRTRAILTEGAYLDASLPIPPFDEAVVAHRGDRIAVGVEGDAFVVRVLRIDDRAWQVRVERGLLDRLVDDRRWGGGGGRGGGGGGGGGGMEENMNANNPTKKRMTIRLIATASVLRMVPTMPVTMAPVVMPRPSASMTPWLIFFRSRLAMTQLRMPKGRPTMLTTDSTGEQHIRKKPDAAKTVERMPRTSRSGPRCGSLSRRRPRPESPSSSSSPGSDRGGGAGLAAGRGGRPGAERGAEAPDAGAAPSTDRARKASLQLGHFTLRPRSSSPTRSCREHEGQAMRTGMSDPYE